MRRAIHLLTNKDPDRSGIKENQAAGRRLRCYFYYRGIEKNNVGKSSSVGDNYRVITIKHIDSLSRG